MFEWWHERKRAEILREPFPPAWHAILTRNVAHYARLTDDERQRLCELTQVFVAEKHWEGCGGLELTDEMRVTIAAQACLMVLELPHRMYRNVEPSSCIRAPWNARRLHRACSYARATWWRAAPWRCSAKRTEAAP